ncbi:hypothetical protein AVM02_03535 [Brucella anthropi]|uniref:hypothetical protein n=1 Tax=Brucella anthropi TaxID=529 RepID=UPI00398842AB
MKKAKNLNQKAPFGTGFKAVFVFAGLCAFSSALSPALAASEGSSKQRAKEVTAVVNAVAQKMPGQPINTVMYIRSNNFEVLAGDCTVRAHIVSSDHKAKGASSERIKVRLNKRRCAR